MSQFFEALNRYVAGPAPDLESAVQSGGPQPSVLRDRHPAFQLGNGPALADESALVSAISRMEAVRRVTETLAPAASYSGDLRIVVAGCASGDGASSVAGAIAIDLSQRLGIRTLMLDADLHNPRIVKMFAVPERATFEGPGGRVQVRSTKWLMLDAVSVAFPADRVEQMRLFDELSQRMTKFAVTVIDAGVVRFDGRLLPLVRRDDPVLVVARAGRTERSDLNTTANVFATLSTSVRGIILNAATPATPDWIRRLLLHGRRR